MANDPSPPQWHCLDGEATAEHLDSDLGAGLSADAAATRLAQVGPNALLETGRRHPLLMLASQFTDFMIVVLIAAAVIAGVVGEPQDAVAIVVIVFLNGIIGFVQEYRADRAMAALKKMASPQARVIRGGRSDTIDATHLVPGDLVELEAGNILPADLRLTELSALKVDESTLTGESQPVDKQLAALPGVDLPLGDRLNLAFKGTVVTYGRARGLVVATGMKTELGRIAALLSGESGKTPLQKRLARFGRHLAIAVLAICAIIFVAGWLRGEPPLVMLLTAVSLAVAAIPEALPAVVTISLALGAARMVRQNALIRRLPAVETLGSVTYICSDKTGTLTLNRMHVDCVLAAGETLPGLPDKPQSPWRELGLAMALCNDAVAGRDGELTGDPTETALLAAAQAAGVDKDAIAADAAACGRDPLRCGTGAHEHAAPRRRRRADAREGCAGRRAGAVHRSARRRRRRGGLRRGGAAGRGRDTGRTGPARAGLRAEAPAAGARSRGGRHAGVRSELSSGWPA